MKECTGKYYILNGELKQSGLFDDSLVYEGESIYEVIRLSDGFPVFFPEHCDRLSNSLKIKQRELLADSNELKQDLKKLVESEKAKDINIKIVFNFNKSANYTMYLIHSAYPHRKQYINGVKGTFCEAERSDPESKVISTTLRAEIIDSLLMENAYEAILVNKGGYITEGSRSNIFLIKGDIVFTAPDNYVLGGITRKHIIEICNEKGISVNYTLIPADRISDYDCAFMTGTSPGVLPFCCIDKMQFSSGHKMIAFLNELYQIRVEESIRRFRIT